MGEQSSSGKSYGDLFTYEKSRRGKGLAFTNTDKQFIIQCSFGS